MKTKTAISLLLLIAALLAPSRSAAQIGDIIRDITRINLELQKTDLLIERADELAASSDNPVVDQFVERARETQGEAWRNFNQRTEAGYRLAYQLTLQARNLVKSAFDNGRRTGSFEGGVLNRLEQVQDLLDRFRERLNESTDGRSDLESLYESSRERLARAWDFYRNGNYRPALKLAEQVENSIARLVRTVDDKNRERGLYERRSEATRELVADARTSLSGCTSPAAEQQVSEAETALRQADELIAASRPGLALKSLQRARDLAQRALQQCDGELRLDERHERIKQAADRLSELLAEISGERVDEIRSLLTQTYDQLARAQSLIASGESESALVALKAAQLTLRQAEELAAR